METILGILESFGPTVAIIVFFLYKDYMRETKMTERLTKHEEFIQNRLMQIIADTNSILQNNTQALRHIIVALSQRTCIAREMGVIKGNDDDGK